MPALQRQTFLVDRIDALLPQTQCTKCGYDGCRPYAQAIAEERAAINQCPPGGQTGIAALAALLGTPELPLNEAHGAEGPWPIAIVDEHLCIGCTLCIKACPVDAIVGARKRMHSVIGTECTGCGLCLPPCPTDCIRLVPPVSPRQWQRADADRARQRFDAHQRRYAPAQRAMPAPVDDDSMRRKAAVQAALARARARRATL